MLLTPVPTTVTVSKVDADAVDVSSAAAVRQLPIHKIGITQPAVHRLTLRPLRQMASTRLLDL